MCCGRFCRTIKRCFKKTFRCKKPKVAINIGEPTHVVVDHDPMASLLNLPGNREFLLREQELGYDHEVVVGRRAGGGNPVVIPLEGITTAASPAAADTGLVRANAA